MAFVVAPEPPLAAWLEALRAQIARSPGFFDARPVIVDLGALDSGTAGIATLIADIEACGISVIDVENVRDIPGLEPWRRQLAGGREGGVVAIREAPPPPPPPPPPVPFVLVEDNIRSGQAVRAPNADVTVTGSVSSGAEVLAGGSIHVYGALRGRALAGVLGFARARIFCRKLEAELVSIDGFYKTAEDMDPALRGKAVQIWLESGHIMMAAQDQPAGRI
jgi:septum site-determining protein MinC